MNFLTIQKQRADELARRWIGNPGLHVSVESLSKLEVLERWTHPEDAELAPLGRRSVERAVIAKNPALRGAGAYSLWVNVDYRGYRGAYKAFVKEVYGVDPGSAFANFDADHLFNKARAANETDYVRLEAIAASVNRAWGSFFERHGSHPRSFASREIGDRNMDFVVAAKLMGLMPPDSPADFAGIQRIAGAFRAIGLAEDFMTRKDPKTGRQVPWRLEQQIADRLATFIAVRGEVAPAGL